jgi:hypothetical protein
MPTGMLSFLPFCINGRCLWLEQADQNIPVCIHAAAGQDTQRGQRVKQQVHVPEGLKPSQSQVTCSRQPILDSSDANTSTIYCPVKKPAMSRVQVESVVKTVLQTLTQ